MVEPWLSGPLSIIACLPTAQDEGKPCGLLGKAICFPMSKTGTAPSPSHLVYGWLDHEEMPSKGGTLQILRVTYNASIYVAVLELLGPQ